MTELFASTFWTLQPARSLLLLCLGIQWFAISSPTFGENPTSKPSLQMAQKVFWLGMSKDEALKDIPESFEVREGPPGLFSIVRQPGDTPKDEIGTFSCSDGKVVSVSHLRISGLSLGAPSSAADTLVRELFAAFSEIAGDNGGRAVVEVAEPIDIQGPDGTILLSVINVRAGMRTLTIALREGAHGTDLQVSETLGQP